MLISIIIPTLDRRTIFDKTLKNAVEAIEHLEGEVIVVNDSKKDRPTIPPAFRKVTLIDNPKRGVASARNAGVRASSGSLLLFLDNDILISKSTIDHIIQLHEQNRALALNLNWEYPPQLQRKLVNLQFGRFLKAHRLTSFEGWYNHSTWKRNELFPATSVASFHLSISRQSFDMTTGYDEGFPHAGFEDYDFPRKLKEAGLKFYIDTRFTVFHNEVDRLELINWLENQERRARTRQVATNRGYPELVLNYPWHKKMLLSIVVASSVILQGALKVIPNKSRYDKLYFKLVDIVQAGKIYKGYSPRSYYDQEK